MEDLDSQGERNAQAARWLRKFVAIAISAVDMGEFTHWFVSDRENRDAFLRMHEAWEQGGGVIDVSGHGEPERRSACKVIALFPESGCSE